MGREGDEIMKIYASIHIGSYGVSLKVFEIVKGKRVKQIDELRRHLDISRDIFLKEAISRNNLLQIVDTLRDMKTVIDTYKVDDYDAYAGYSLSAAKNYHTLFDQARIQCGIKIRLLDNSTQRFFVYKALCSVENFFDIIQEPTVIVDIGGSDLQLTVFSQGKLITTQHIFRGATSVWDSLQKTRQSADYREQLLNMLCSEIGEFYHTLLDEVPMKRLVFVNNLFATINKARQNKNDGFFTKHEYLKIVKKILKDNTYSVLSEEVGEDVDDMRLSFLLLYRALIESLPIEEVYVPPLSLHEGMVSEYVYTHKLMPLPRDFDEDIYSSSWAIAHRYMSNTVYIEELVDLSGKLFDAIKKRHGLSQRSRMLLKVAVILHECGKFISLSNEAHCTFMIITSSEILGLSEREREMIAWICYFYKEGERPYDELSSSFTREEYFTIIKLYAIMSLAGSLDVSHLQKYKDIRFRFNGRDELFVSIDTQDSLTLEKGFFKEKGTLFEDIFAIHPTLRTIRFR